jgi:Zn-dependent protease
VSLAGSASNFAIATAAALLLRLGGIIPSDAVFLEASIKVTNPFINFLFYLILVNLFLGIFNLIPIPPLDGSKILSAYLPRNLAWKYKKIAPYGLIIILFLFYFNILGNVLTKLIYIIIKFYSFGA